MKRLVFIFTLAFLVVISNGQTLPPPFTNCPSTGFQVINSPSQFQTVNLATGVTNTVATYGIDVNAIGYNPIDQRIYGIRGTSPLSLVAIGSNYAYETVATFNGSLQPSVVGDINSSGILWCWVQGANSIYTVNCNSTDAVNFGRITVIGPKPNANIADWSFPPNDNTRIYSVTNGGGLIYMSTATSLVTSVLPDATVPAQNYGATYFDGGGNFYAKSNNSGIIYKFANVTAGTPVVSIFSTSSTSTANDGARCATAAAPIIADFGDAPDTYGTTTSSGGPIHLLASPNAALAQIYFGSAISIDVDGNPGTGAGNDTDDGISSFTPISGGLNPPPIPFYNVTVNVHNTSASVSNVSGWIDWNNNGLFDAGERATATVPAGYIGNTTLTWNNVSLSGTSGTTGTYGRFRISTADLSSPVGTVADGEVEDYYIPFLSVLPVTITTFSAIKSHSLVYLNWVTATEHNNKGFAIERSSDGVSFEQLAFIPSKAGEGNSDQKINYNSDDKNPLSGDSYYRLKQTDFDGNSKYSITAKVTNSDLGTATAIYPNPARDEISIDGLKGNETIFIYSQKGELIRKEKANGTRLTIKINDVSSGIYHLKITDAAGNSRTRKIVKQ